MNWFNEVYVFLFHLSLYRSPRLKIPGISSYGHFAPITYIIGLPDAEKRYTQKLFEAITAPEFKSISAVRMCEQSHGM